MLLYLVCFWDNIVNLRELIGNGCVVDIEDKNGVIVFYYVVFYNNVVVLKCLLNWCEFCLVLKLDNFGKILIYWVRYFGYV